ncbi:MAG TPA: sirohydrochlorin nickelochelatase [Methanothermococcus okinawensis]|uniref:Sirohydrochlorin cobaltochelatase n=1 Tax=Methanofervidicoccus abyssi TaxID=2082189 RepID=A0A401HPN0_9EURY|nr:sirohydrochlorin nickelochelatase [Methanofervidicoccus abyssi]GBF36189.1 sirohydrochlorin cobaltochelatase [Methanofervidicoccus abyssi]HIP15632.1 sirohydrochlorin nickelochelatase [Methanothermococcus okinawensis]HIP35141.1 sirohydrochlorin nickelochelatase [Methanothermococcus okinawensis]
MNIIEKSMMRCSMEALVLIGHGSRLPYSKEVINKIAEKIRKRNIYPIVEVGMMEFNEPTIPQAIKKVIEKGAKKIIVVPVFLAHGNHTKRDIPKILGIYNGEEENSHHHEHHHHHHHHEESLEIPENVEIVYREPIGPDDRLVDIIIDRALGN